DQAQWRALTGLVELPGDGDLATRRAHEEQIDAALAAWTSGQDAAVLAARLQAAGIPPPVVATRRDLGGSDDHRAARRFYPELRHPVAGPVRHEGIVARFSATPGALASPAPLLGQHTAEVLGELLGLDTEQLAALHAAGVTE